MPLIHVLFEAKSYFPMKANAFAENIVSQNLCEKEHQNSSLERFALSLLQLFLWNVIASGSSAGNYVEFITTLSQQK